MMTASAVYATYSVAGNDGRPQSFSGIDKIASAYRDVLVQVQEARKALRFGPKAAKFRARPTEPSSVQRI